jgi:hypothetical protein
MAPLFLSRTIEVSRMRPTLRVIALAVGVFTLVNTWGPNPIGTARAQEESKPIKSARGGALAKVGPYQFEVFFYATGLRVFPQDATGAPFDASKLTGTATFYHPNSPEPWIARPLRPAAASPGQASESLDLAIDLSRVPPMGGKAAFAIAGLPDPAQPTARFPVPFEFVEAPAEFRAERPAIPEVHGYAPIASEAYYFPLAGYYNTPEGVVWVPARGYYHVVAPTQYYPPEAYPQPAGWQLAHPAPWPRSRVATYSGADSGQIHTEYFWHPRAIGEPAAHEAWIREQWRQKYGPGSGP